MPDTYIDDADKYLNRLLNEEKFESLNSAAKHGTGYAAGPTEIWYMKPEFFRDGIFGYNYLKKENLLPKADNLSKTHILLGSIKETDPDKIFQMMQGENWSPAGEAKDLIKEKGLKHTSMSMGDVIVTPHKTLMVDFAGFAEIK